MYDGGMRVLIVEDNEKLARNLKEILELDSYAVDNEFDGESGERKALLGYYDLIILDIMLPKKDGIEVCKSLRANDINSPIMLLTSKGEADDKVAGLDSGADDYIVKPFDIKELLARVRALLRRPREKVDEILSVQDIRIDCSARKVTKKNKEIKLTLKEYTVLEYLVRNQNVVLSRKDILDHCWDFAYDPYSNIVDAYIKQLRKKLNDNDEKYIKAVRGVGYKFAS